MAPRTPTEEVIAGVWADLLRLPEVGVHDDFFHLGGHSLLAAQVVARLRRDAGLALSLRDFFARPTVAALAEHVSGTRAPLAATGDWLELQAGAGSHPPLFLIHPGGGQIARYVDFAAGLDPAERVLAMEHPGLHDAALVGLGVPALAERYLAALRKLQPGGPYTLAGWSLGGVIAYAMAQRLCQTGDTVAWLGLFDSPAPPRSAPAQPAPAPSPNRVLARFLRTQGFQGPTLDEALALVCEASGREALAHLHPHAIARGWLPAGLSREQWERFHAVYAEGTAAAKVYHVPDPLPLPITFFRRSEGAGAESSGLGWVALPSTRFEIVAAPGDHDSMFEAPQVTVLARLAQGHLNAHREGTVKAEILKF